MENTQDFSFEWVVIFQSNIKNNGFIRIELIIDYITQQ